MRLDFVKIYFLLLIAVFLSFKASAQSGDQLHIALAITSSSYSEIESSFGHSFLVIYDTEYPNLDNYAVSILAETRGQKKDLSYLYMGLTGGFQNKMIIEPFSEKYHQYSLVEKRDIYFYELQLNEEQIQHLLSAVKKNQFDAGTYYFINQNCVTGLTNLIKSSGFKFKKNSGLIHTPNKIFSLIDDKSISKKYSLQSPIKITTDSATYEVLDFYGGNRSHDHLNQINSLRMQSVQLDYKNLDKDSSQFYPSDQKISFFYSANQRKLRLSLVEKGYLDESFNSFSINELKIMNLTIVEKEDIYNLRELKIIEFQKKQRSDFKNKFPFNWGFNFNYSKSQKNIQFNSLVSLGSTFELYDRYLPFFYELEYNLTNQHDNHLKLKLITYLYHNKNWAHSVQYISETTYPFDDNRPYHFNFESNYFINNEFVIRLAYEASYEAMDQTISEYNAGLIYRF